MANSPKSASLAMPIGQHERIIFLDSLRGIAVLGILLMNIPGFGLAHLLIFDVSVLKERGLNFFSWYVFGPGVFEGSFRAIFSMLFGAGIIIFISRLEKRMKKFKAVEFFFRRQLWLLLFGLFNAYLLLWSWDILFPYAICGLLLFSLRQLKPKYLFTGAGICLLLITANENLELYKQKAVITKGEKIVTRDTNKIRLTVSQKEYVEAVNAIKQRSDAEQKRKKIEKQNGEMRGSFSEIYHARNEMRGEDERKNINNFLIADVLLFMLIGIAFFKKGILQGEAKTKLYMWMAVLGLGIGLPLSYLYLQPGIYYQHNYFEIIKHKNFEFYELQRFLHSMGIFGLIMLLYKSGWFKWLFTFMQPVGQMAFTNYLVQSFLCGLFFYGIGFSMFGKLQRYELYFVAPAVWVFEIAMSHVWLQYFRFGPFEWTWRSLTYWKIQPMRKNKKVNTIC